MAAPGARTLADALIILGKPIVEERISCPELTNADRCVWKVGKYAVNRQSDQETHFPTNKCYLIANRTRPPKWRYKSWKISIGIVIPHGPDMHEHAEPMSRRHRKPIAFVASEY